MKTSLVNTQGVAHDDNYVTIDYLAAQTGLSVPLLKERLLELNLMDRAELPLGQALQSPVSRYRFFEQEGHLEGEWLLHRDLISRL